MNALPRRDAHARATPTAWAAARSRRLAAVPEPLAPRGDEADRPASSSRARCSTSGCAFGKTIPADAKIIQLDMDATLIGQNRRADVGLVGNLACTFELLLEEMKNPGAQLDFTGWRDELRAIEVDGREEGRGGAEQRRDADRPAAHVPRGARLARDARRHDRDRRRRRHRRDGGEDPAGAARGRVDGSGPARHARRRHALRARRAARASRTSAS